MLGYQGYPLSKLGDLPTDEETEALKLKLKLKALFYKKMTEANDAESEPGLSDDSISSPTVVIIGKFTCEERPHRKN